MDSTTTFDAFWQVMSDCESQCHTGAASRYTLVHVQHAVLAQAPAIPSNHNPRGHSWGPSCSWLGMVTGPCSVLHVALQALQSDCRAHM
jgi:hypothetical protein